MSDKIWNNPLMWQTKKSKSDSDVNFEDGFDFDFEELEKSIKDAQNQFSLIDTAAKASEYKETTPEMMNTGNAVTSGLTDVFKDKKLDSTKPEYLLNKILGDISTKDIPPLKSLLEQGMLSGLNTNNNNNNNTVVNINIFDNDDEADTMIANKLGITMDDIFDKGIAIGLSPLDIVDNLDALRSATSLKIVTNGTLNSRALTELYQASLNSDEQAGQSVLNKNNIALNKDISINDIMSLAQAANNKIFKSIYLN